MPKFNLLWLYLAIFTVPLYAQTSENYAVSIQAEIQENPAQITIYFNQDPYAVSYFVYRKLTDVSNWGAPIANLSSSDSLYVDANVQVGVSYEYRILKQAQAGSNNFTGYGYINAGIKVPAIENRGGIMLLIDSSLFLALGPEISRLILDLKGDGWSVLTHTIAPSMSVTTIKSIIYSDYISSPLQNKTVFLLGNITVPYSGQIYPDGHPNHEGAWPADTYYADMNGVWTDNVVNITSTYDTRNHNIPGDGKFDQSLFVDLELEVGRVDLSNLPSFSLSEVELMRQYLNKNHQFRHKKVVIGRQAVIDDNFSNYAEAFAANGYRNFPAFFGADKVYDADYVTSLKNDSYLWSYGCGAGTQTSCSGVANTNTFVNDSLASVFTMLFGSYFGDWDRNDNFLRAALASGNTLTNCWGGRPNYYFHHMAMGKHIGYSTLLSQNNSSVYYAGLTSKWIHSALMGDPSLRMHTVAPAQSLILDTLHQNVVLQWTAATDTVLGYYIYRKPLLSSSFQRINAQVHTDTFYVDSCQANGSYEYMIRAVILESSASGTYYNLSQGIFDTIVVQNNAIVADYSYSLSDSTAIFANSSTAATQYLWDFGDSTFSTDINPQHTYAQNGTYTVELIAFNPCSTDTFSRQVEVSVYTNVKQLPSTFVWVYPNPVKDYVHIDLKSMNELFSVRMYDALGRLVYQNNNTYHRLKVCMKPFIRGTYLLKISSAKGLRNYTILKN
jgi:hypothetical protein